MPEPQIADIIDQILNGMRAVLRVSIVLIINERIKAALVQRQRCRVRVVRICQVRIGSAAKIVDVDRRTIYNYVKNDKVQSFKVAGSTLRVCSHCLLKEAFGRYLIASIFPSRRLRISSR